MTLSRYLIVMAFSAILGWIAWILVLLYIDPFTSGLSGFIFFYISLIFALIGTLSVAGYFVRSKFHKEEMTYQQVANAFRQAILLSVLVTISLFLRAQELLKWWNIILLIAGLTLLEIFIIGRKSKRTFILEDAKESEQFTPKNEDIAQIKEEEAEKKLEETLGRQDGLTEDNKE